MNNFIFVKRFCNNKNIEIYKNIFNLKINQKFC